MNAKPTIHELCEYVRVHTKWYKFGVLLELNTTELDAIRLMTGDDDFKALKMFELWLSTNPKATRREIIETLTKEAIGENTVAEEYKETLKESEFMTIIYFLLFFIHKTVQKELPSQILQKHSEHLILPMEVVQTLYTEGVISKETLDNVQRSGGSLTDDPLRALCCTVSKDPKNLKVLASILLQSEDTVHAGNVILKEYGKWFKLLLSLQYYYFNRPSLSSTTFTKSTKYVILLINMSLYFIIIYSCYIS